MPDAASACPIPAFAAPTASAASRPLQYAAAIEPASVGSPSAVPVPCASTPPTADASRPATAIAATSRPRCAEPLGAVRLALRPSCRTALPLSSRLLDASSDTARSTVEPTPSLRT
eukprot:scaffold72143_cov75-Phaeocystis_antarctica.AAC.1